MGAFRQLPPVQDAVGHAGEVCSCAFSADGALALSGGWDGELRIWDASDGRGLANLPAGNKPISACAVAPDGQTWLSGSMEGMLTSWDGVSRLQRWNFLAHTRPISSIRFAPDGQLLASTSWDRQIAIRRVGKEKEARMLSGHEDIVSGCAFTPDAHRLLSWSYDGTARLWDLNTCRELCILGDHGTRIASGDVTGDGRWAVTGAIDGGLKLWDLNAGLECGAAVLPTEVRSLTFLPDAVSFVAADANGLLTLLSAPAFEVIDQLALDMTIMCGALAPAVGRMALGGEDGLLRIVAIDGYEDTPLLVTALQGARDAASSFERLFGRTRLIPTHQFTCPSCRQATEKVGEIPAEVFACPFCTRRLRVGTTLTPMLTI